MRKYLYLIKKKKIKSWLKFWLLTKDQVKYVLSEILEGFSFNLQNTVKKRFKIFNIFGNSVQNGTPTPENPVPIHSVADDDINIFNAEKIENYNIKVKDNGKTIIMPVVTSGNGNTNTATKLNVLCPDLQVGDVVYIRFKRNLNNVKNHFIYLYGSNKIMYAKEDSPSYTITQEDLNSYVFLYGNDYDYGETEQCIITDFKIQKNTVPINYSPYNQGTVTIKQETVKNYLDWNKFIDYSNWIDAESAGYKSFEISGLDTNKIYTLCRVDTAGYGEELKYAGFLNYKDNENIFLHSTNNSQNLKNISSFPTQDGKIYINMFMNSQSDLNDYIAIIKKCWVIEGTDYEPYQANDYTIQTEPLRSLPNGVRDSLEADGIHRKIGIQTGTLSQTTTITLSDAKQNGAYMCNIKSAGTLTGQTIELEAGDYKIIYELEEEIIEPYTEEQQAEYDKIKELYTFDGTTNISSTDVVPPYLQIQYYMKGE